MIGRGIRSKMTGTQVIGIAGIFLTDISERKRAEEALMASESKNQQLIKELEIANIKAVQAARVKGDFLANMSHEIRTPMNGVIGTLELLNGTVLNQEQKEYVTTATKSAEFYWRLLTMFLISPKLKRGNFK